MRALVVPLIAALLCGPAPAQASVADAQRQAHAAAAAVDALLAQQAAATADVRAASAALGIALAGSAAAEREREAREAQARTARQRRARLVRDLYASGGSMTLLAVVVDARSPEDALARAATAQRAMDGLLASLSTAAAANEAAVAAARGRQAAADAAGEAREQALAVVQARGLAADEALASARARLAELDARARQLAEAQAAAARLAAAAADAEASVSAVPDGAIPAEFLAAYQAAAATCPGMDWTLLAAVGEVESGHGRANGPSSAGAVGPMQFMPATFAAYAVDGDGDGQADPWDPEDAIFTAAGYLCRFGAGTPTGVRPALLAYNHAGWYVDLVLAAQRGISG